MPLHLIYARARNNVIGVNGDLPWHLPEDLAHFKRTTLGQPVIMGRITWESIPEKFRPLPGRTNVVVSRQTEYEAVGAQVVASLQAAMDLFSPDQVVWLIGGAQLYAQAMPYAQQLVVTEIDADFQGDAWAPGLIANEWQETERTRHVSAQGLAYSLVTLQRK
ncbi:MAG: dihydrofolate reductase [Burkholderiales bacterium]|nr:dihydrofolate reductase [Burkholderiales bacterium]